LLDATQLVLAGALRGAGDTWFVLVAAIVTASTSILIGVAGEGIAMEQYGISTLYWWWTVITIWIFLLAIAMVIRYWQAKWQTMRMVS